MGKAKNYDPDNIEVLSEVDEHGLTVLQKEFLRDAAKRLNTIYIYKIENGAKIVDVAKTKQARESFILINRLKFKAKGEQEVRVEYYAKNFEIAYDEQGLPVYRFKTIQQAA